MKYSYEIDPSQLETGDVLVQHTCFNLFQPVTWFSWIIRIFTKSYWNHADDIIKYIDEKGNPHVRVIGALGGGVTIRTFGQWANTKIKKKILVRRMVDFDYENDKYVIRSMSQLDKKYDRKGIFQLGILIILGLWNPSSTLTYEKKWWCSEYCAWLKDLPGWNKFLPKDFVSSNLFVTVSA